MTLFVKTAYIHYIWSQSKTMFSSTFAFTKDTTMVFYIPKKVCYHRRQLYIEILGESLIKGQISIRVYQPLTTNCKIQLHNFTASTQSPSPTKTMKECNRKRGRYTPRHNYPTVIKFKFVN